MTLSKAAKLCAAFLAILIVGACTTVDLNPGNSEAEAPVLSAAQQSLRDSALALEQLSEDRGWVTPDGMGERARRWADMLLHGVSGDDGKDAPSDPYQAWWAEAGDTDADRARRLLADLRDAQDRMVALNDAAAQVAAAPEPSDSLTEDLRILEASAQRSIKIGAFFESVLAAPDAAALKSRATIEKAVSSLDGTAERMASLADALADRRRASQAEPALS